MEDVVIRKASGADASDLSDLFVESIGAASNVERMRDQLERLRRQSDRGIGKKLVHALESYAREHQCADMMLASSEHRGPAHRIYESIGYRGIKRGFVKQIR